MTFAVAGILFLALAARVPRVAGPDLWPTPDALEYALLTDSFLHAQSPVLHLGPHVFPSRYAFVYPLLSAPPAWVLEQLTSIQHKDYSYLTRLYWVALLFGLLSVLGMVHVGGWLTGSRWGGLMAGLLWGTHPALVRWATVNMSETMLVTVWLALLAALRPWLDARESHKDPSLSPVALGLRGLAAGGLAGLLTVAKAPFVFWAIAACALLFWHARRTRRWTGLAACISAGGAVAAAEAAWRGWAFGSPLANGYAYWHPEIYGHLSKTFNVRFVFENAGGPGNAAYYGRGLLGLQPDFFSPWLTGTLALGLIVWIGVTVLRLKKKHENESGQPPALPGRTWALLTGWDGVMLLFCGLYFFQCERFSLLIVPLADLAMAGMLVKLARGRHGRVGQTRGRWAARAAAVTIGVGLLIAQLSLGPKAAPLHGPQPVCARTQQMPALLAQVPQGAWLFTNYQLAAVQRLREQGQAWRCGALYVNLVPDQFFNGHSCQATQTGLAPMGTNPQVSPEQFRSLPPAWQTAIPSLLDPQGRWSLSSSQQAALGPVYILLAQPPYFPTISQLWQEQYQPALTERGTLEKLSRQGDMTLYRLTPRPAHQASENKR